MSFMFLPQPVSGIIFDKTVKKKKNQNKTKQTNKQTNKQKQQQQKLLLRDGPLEKLWGGGEFSSCKNFFSSSDSLHEFYLGHCMNIFRVKWRA